MSPAAPRGTPPAPLLPPGRGRPGGARPAAGSTALPAPPPARCCARCSPAASVPTQVRRPRRLLPPDPQGRTRLSLQERLLWQLGAERGS